MSLAALAEQIQAEPPMASSCPMFLHVADNLPPEEMHRWQRLAQEFNLRLVDSSPQQLADQLAR